MASNPKRIEASQIKLRKQLESDNTALATWEWSREHTIGYRVQWSYLTLDGVWFNGKDEELSVLEHADKYDTYDYPTLALKLRFRIKPLADSHEVNETKFVEVTWEITSPNQDIYGNYGKQTVTGTRAIETKGAPVEYWVAEWSPYVEHVIVREEEEEEEEDPTPAMPDAPEMENANNTLKLKATSYDKNTTHIRFDIWVGDEYSCHSSAFLQLVGNVVRWEVPVTIAGYRYKARAQGYNAAYQLTGEWSRWTGDVGVVPGDLGNLTAVAASSSSVRLQWSVGYDSSVINQYRIEWANDPTYFDQVSSVQSTTITVKNPYTIIDGLATGKRWFFRIQANNNYGSSRWSNIADVILGTTPSAPTIWSSKSVIVYDEILTFYWVHNSEDKSKEVEAMLRISYPNGAVTEWTYKKTNDSEISSATSSFYEASWMPEGAYRWTVRTKGLTGVYGPYAEEATFSVLKQPVIGITFYKERKWLWNPFNFTKDSIYTAPGVFSGAYLSSPVEITQYPIYVMVTMTPMTQTPLECNFSIYSESSYKTIDHLGKDMWVHEGDRMYNKTFPYNGPTVQGQVDNMGLSKNQFALILTPGDILLENHMSYKLVCTAVSNNTLTAVAEMRFRLNIVEEEFIPDAEIGVDRGAIVSYIKPYCYDTNGNPLVGIRMSVYRIMFDGGLIKIEGDVDSLSGTMITDPHPNLNYARYRIVAYSVRTGSYTYYDLPAYPVDVPEIVIQWDERWESFYPGTGDELANPVWGGSMLRLPWNVDTSESNTIDVELVEYIGREHPVSYYGTQVGQEMTLSADIPKGDNETIYFLRRLSRYMGDVYVREPNGAGYWAQVAVSFNTTHVETVIPISISVKRVEGGM